MTQPMTQLMTEPLNDPRGTVLVAIEVGPKGVTITSAEALTFARRLNGALHAVPIGVLGAPSAQVLDELSRYGVTTVHITEDDRLAAYSGTAWAAAVVDVARTVGAQTVLATGSLRGMEVMAHVAARMDVAMAANVTAVQPGHPPVLTRQVVGGTALEECVLDDPVAVFTVAGHACDPEPAGSPVQPEVVTFTPELTDADLVARVVRTEAGEPDQSAALTSAKVVVGGGRGAGSAEGFTQLVELSELLGGSLGVSRVVTSLGWRPHHEQIGQTGTRVTPDLYLACGISGAIQHWTGMSASKTIVAINTDPEAPMVTRAHYAVIGDLHQVVPAINEEIRRRRN